MMTEYETYCVELEAAALDIDGVSNCEVKRAKAQDVARVRYTGTASEPEVYSALNFSRTIQRPAGAELMVYKVPAL